jgi:hypothetical protein
MPRKYSVNAVLAGIEKIDRVWTDNPTFTLGEITHQSVQEKIADLRQMVGQAETVRMQMTALNNDINNVASELAAINSRALSGLRAVYGPNSTQYEQGGGTPQRDRKRPSRKNVSGKKSGGGNNNGSGENKS